MVGTSGRADERCALNTASARSFPSLICGTAGESTTHAIGVWPPRVDWVAGAQQLKGAGTGSVAPSESVNNSPDSEGVVPFPAEAKLYLPGLALMSATSSWTLFAGSDGLTTSTFGA